MLYTRVVLGASDPEMAAIAALAADCGIPTVQALDREGRPVSPRSAAMAASPIPEIGDLWVECAPRLPDCPECGYGLRGDGRTGGECLRCGYQWEAPPRADHHAPGDPGFGFPPGSYLAGSSIGQVAQAIGMDRLPTEILLVAAADHCLGAAYRGECPGVDPDDLLRWRAESRAAFQHRPVEAVLADIESARESIRRAPVIWLVPECPIGAGDPSHDTDGAHPCPRIGVDMAGFYTCDGCSLLRAAPVGRDLRGQHIAELPDAQARDGRNVLVSGLSRPGEPGKLNAMGSLGWCSAFLAAVQHGDVEGTRVRSDSGYGDPGRGIVGCEVSE